MHTFCMSGGISPADCCIDWLQAVLYYCCRVTSQHWCAMILSDKDEEAASMIHPTSLIFTTLIRLWMLISTLLIQKPIDSV